MKASTLAKLQQAALDGACQLFYFDQSGFSAFHHNIDQETIDRWFLEHRMVLFYLRPTAPS